MGPRALGGLLRGGPLVPPVQPPCVAGSPLLWAARGPRAGARGAHGGGSWVVPHSGCPRELGGPPALVCPSVERSDPCRAGVRLRGDPQEAPGTVPAERVASRSASTRAHTRPSPSAGPCPQVSRPHSKQDPSPRRVSCYLYLPPPLKSLQPVTPNCDRPDQFVPFVASADRGRVSETKSFAPF